MSFHERSELLLRLADSAASPGATRWEGLGL